VPYFSAAGTEYISWALYGREYLIFILFLLAVLLTQALRFGRWEKANVYKFFPALSEAVTASRKKD
jgi:hypothetical protein